MIAHGSRIQSIAPDTTLIGFSRRALAAIPQRILYGRVDLVKLPNGQPVVMELGNGTACCCQFC